MNRKIHLLTVAIFLAFIFSGIAIADKPEPVLPAKNLKVSEVLALRETSLDKTGHIQRLRVVKTDFKYPNICINETILKKRDKVSGQETETVLDQKAIVADHIVVGLRPGMTEKDLKKVCQKFGVNIRRTLVKNESYLIEIPIKGVDSVQQAVKTFSKENNIIKYAEPDHIVTALATIPNDILFDQLWGMNNTGQKGGVPDADIDAPEAWDISTGSYNVLVGVVDTGIDYNHEDLAANIWTNPGEIPGNGIDDDHNGYIDDIHGWDFYNNDNDPMGDHFHGSHCAGTIGGVGNNNKGVAGVCWNVKMAAIKFLSSTGSGTDSDAALALRYATTIGVDLTSNSWGGGFSQLIKDAITDANDHGVLCVAAAGNASTDIDLNSECPGGLDNPNIICVAATDRYDQIAGFSNYGEINVDLGAPGVDITSCMLNNTYGSASGTSMATPHVAGACALVKSGAPNLSHLEIKKIIMDSVDPIPALAGITVTGGRLNVWKALAMLNPNIVVNAIGIDDDNIGGTWGNSDSIANPGERIGLIVKLENLNVLAAHGVTATLSTTDSNIQIIDNSATYGEIPGRTAVNPTDQFIVNIPSGLSTPYSIPFTMVVQDSNSHVWNLAFNHIIDVTRTVSGTVTLDSAPLQGASVTYVGPNGALANPAITNSSGNYTVYTINGNHTFTASKSNYVDAIQQINIQSNLTGVNFAFTTATMRVTVTDNVTGSPIQGATVEYTGVVSDSNTTNSSGFCQFVRAFGRPVNLAFIAKKRTTHFDSDTVEVNVPPDVNINLQLRQPTYAFTAIGDINMVPHGLDMDDTGNFIVGSTEDDADIYKQKAVYWENGVVHSIYPDRHIHNEATGVNNSHQVCGQYWVDTGTPWPIYHPFLWSGGSFTDLLQDQNDVSRFTYGINNIGQIITTDYLWDSGNWIYIGGYCQAINDLSQVAGATDYSTGQAFVWQGGVTTLLSTVPGFHSSLAWDISNSGWVVGQMEVNSTDPDYVYQYKAYMWKKNGFVLDLGGLPGETSHYAKAVNNCGQIVGNSITSTLSGGSAWIWENGGPPQNLNKLVLPNIGWHLSYPNAINDNGQILGQASDGWNWTAFVLTPTLPQCNATLAYDPTPADGATGTRISLTLTWRSGNGATQHDVYFGTNANAVADANHSSPEFKGTTSIAGFNPGALSYNTSYYWRIDEIGGTCSRKGETWSFMTGGTTPVADFTGSPTSGTSPLIVNFRDTSQGGTITAWSWNFGDSGTSNLENPTHAYTSAGTFTVSLTATGPGGSNTKTKTNYITTAPAAPVANFFGLPTSGPAPLTVNFTDKTTGAVTGWSWNFGEVGGSNAQNPSHVYNSNGTYTVELIVSNAGGSDELTKTSYITVTSPPVAAFSASPTSGVAPLNVSFTDSSTGTITARSWNFGDGATSTAQNPSHSYSAGGAYSVTLIVTGPGGMNTCTKTAYIQIWTTYNNSNTGGAIGNNNINAVGIESGGIRWFCTNGGGLAKYDGTNWTKYTTSQGLAGNVVNHIAFDSSANKWVATGTGVGKYTGSSWTKYTTANSGLAGNNCYSIAAEGAIIWVGTYDKGACKFNGSSWQTYNTTNSGIAGVRINDIAIDGSGNKWFATMNGVSKYDGTTWTTYASQLPSDDVYGAVIAPNGDKWFATVSGVSKLTGSSWTTYTQSQGLAKNDNRSIDVAPDGTVWAGSNGSGASKFTGSTPWIVYSTSNSGLVSNTVNAVGTEGSTLVWFGTASGVSKYDSTPQSPPAAPNAQFTGSPTSGNFPLTVNFTDQSTGSILIRSWSFGDGDTSLTQNPSHAYQYAGVYSVSLTVTGPGGSNTQTKTGYITVTTPPAPNAAFSGSPTSGLIPLAVNFNNQSTGNITSYSWNFGDGGGSAAQNPSHSYSSAGTYTVTLVATGPGGNDVEMKNNYITANIPLPPVADFNASPTSGTRPLTVNFTDLSSGTVSSWMWDFGDSGSSNTRNPSHIYQSDGLYTVSLIVSGPGGNDSETKVNYISVSTPLPPVADFSGSPTSGYYPLTVTFTDLSTGQINTWSWTFGDSGTSTLASPTHIYQSLGVFTVGLTVTGYGGSDTETKVNYITTSTPPAPVAQFTGSPTTGYAPLTVNFTDQSTNNPAAWSWTFGDGGSSTAQNTSHIYNNAGTYTVSLTASNPGGSDNETKTNYITVYPAPSTFTDNFNRADSTTLGNGWTEVQGDLKILSNEVRNEAIQIYHMAIQGSLSGTYQDVACDFARTTSNGAPRFGVMLRYQDINNYYYVWRQTGGTNRLYISKVVNGVKTDLANTSISGPGVNTLFTIEGIADGTTLKLKLNGVEKVSTTDSTFSSGSCGIQFGPTSNTDSHRADNFSATIGSL